MNFTAMATEHKMSYSLYAEGIIWGVRNTET